MEIQTNIEHTSYMPDYIVQPTLDGKAHILARQIDETYARIGTINTPDNALKLVAKANEA